MVQNQRKGLLLGTSLEVHFGFLVGEKGFLKIMLGSIRGHLGAQSVTLELSSGPYGAPVMHSISGRIGTAF